MDKYKIGREVSLIYRYSQIYFDSKLRGYKLGSGQYIFLINLLLNNGISQEELSDIVKINKSTTARAIASLEREKYVIREKDKDDKRFYKLYTTKKAEAIKNTLLELMASWNDIMLFDFSEEEKKTLYKLIDRVGSNIRKHSDEI